MNRLTRSDFLQLCGGLLLWPLLKKNIHRPLLSFSTLGCPDWSLDDIIRFAVANHYDGVEIRGIQRELDLPVSKHFATPSAIAATKQQFNDHQLRIVDLGSSCELHHAQPLERQKNLDEGKRFIDLASKIGCPYIRVFPNNIPADRDKSKTMELMTAGLDTLGNYAAGSGVKVLMETHGDLLLADDILKVIAPVNNSNTGLVWDVTNMWSKTKESPSAVYQKLKQYIFHTHIKDLRMVNDKEQYEMLGQGEVPIFEAIDLLLKEHYPGFFSFEWEKLWHPEIPAPEIALADFPVTIAKHLQHKE